MSQENVAVIENVEHLPAIELMPESNATPLAPISNSAESIMSIIAQLSTNPTVDVDKIERLMTIYTTELERQESKIKQRAAEEAKRLFNIDFIAMKPDLPMVIRTKTNDHTKSNYAPLEEVNKTIDPILAKHGFATSAIVTQQTDASVTMELSVIHRAGHEMMMTLTMPIDDKGPNGTKNKTTAQGISSSMTTMKRVGFCAMLNISTGDDKDGNAPSGEPVYITVEQAVQLDLDIKAAGLDRVHFLKWAGVDDPRFVLAKNLKKLQTEISKNKKGAAK